MLRSVIRFLNAEGLLKDSTVLFTGMAGGHVLNLCFQIIMGRCLAPEEYALLIALLGILNILASPLGAVASSMNRYTGLLVREGRAGDVRRLILFWGRRFGSAGIILSLGCFLLPEQMAHFFHLNRTAPILIFGIILPGVFFRPVLDGALMGMQCFGYSSVKNLVAWGLRLLIGALLVWQVSPFAGWGLLGHGLGVYAAMGLGLCFLLIRLKGIPGTEQPLPKMRQYLWGSFLVLTGYSVLMTGDIILVKHLHPEQAGAFAYAATLGRLVVFVPQAFVAAMFPKVVSAQKGTSAQRNLCYKTLLMTLAATCFSALIFTGIVKWALWGTFGLTAPSENTVLWSRMLAWDMIPVAPAKGFDPS